MPDFIDKAVDAEIEILNARINKMRQVQKQNHLIPRGNCYYCEESLRGTQKVFCDLDCSNDYNKYVRRT